MAQEIAVKFSALRSAPQACQAGYFALAEAKKKWQRMMLIRNFIELILIHLAGDGSGWRLGEITCGPQRLASGPRLAAASNTQHRRRPCRYAVSSACRRIAASETVLRGVA